MWKESSFKSASVSVERKKRCCVTFEKCTKGSLGLQDREKSLVRVSDNGKSVEEITVLTW